MFVQASCEMALDSLAVLPPYPQFLWGVWLCASFENERMIKDHASADREAVTSCRQTLAVSAPDTPT